MSASTPDRRPVSTRAVVLTGLLVALVLAAFVSYYASSKPDGLEYVAGQQGFAENAQEHRTSADSPMVAYATKGIEDDRASGALAGITGTIAVLVLAGGAALLLRRRDADPERT